MLDDDTLRRIRNHARHHSAHPFKASNAGSSDFVVLISRFADFDREMLELALDEIDEVRATHSDCVSCSAKILAFCERFSRHLLAERHAAYCIEYQRLTHRVERNYREEVEAMIESLA
jgi:hypothetical protein